MKTYIVRYVTTDEKVKKGDKVLYKGKHICEVKESLYGKGLYLCAPKNSHPYLKDEPKVKLVLCKSDTVIGDENMVIKEISPDALKYIKEGDQFDENEVEIWRTSVDSYTKPFYKIKGPCGHFH